MFISFIRIAFRNLTHNKVYSIINIGGLSIGITSFMLITLYVNHEYSYDKFFENSERLYRVGLNYDIDGIHYYTCLNPVPLAFGLKQDFPEIENVTRLYNRYFSGGYTIVKYQEKQFREDKLFWADSTVFKVLGIELIQGNQKEALRNPNSVVLTTETAYRYFGEDDPIGKTLQFDDGFVYQVTGIAKEFPENSHIHFDLLASIHTNQRLMNHPDWIDVKNYVYIILKEGANIKQIENQMQNFQEKYLEPEIKYITKLSYREFKEKKNSFDFMFEPVTDIHLKTIFEGDSEPQSNRKQVLIFAFIGVIILLVACINFINLTTAVAAQRAKEVVVRKVVGSSKRLVITQFFVETLVVVCVSFMISLLLVKLFIPLFNDTLNLKLEFSIFKNLFYLPFGFALIISVSFLAGFYPSVLLSSYNSIDILKGKFTKGKNGALTRTTLVVVQNIISILLIIAALVIFTQLDYMKSKKLGINTDNLIVVQRPNRLKTQVQVFKEIVDENPLVLSSTYSYGAPQMVIESMVYFTKENEKEESFTVERYPTDFDFIDTYGIELVDGRKLDKNISTDSTAVVLTKTAVRVMGIENPLEKEIYYSYEKDVPLKIVGIVKDFHSASLHVPIRPTIIIINRDRPPMYYIVRYKGGFEKETVEFLKSKWEDFLPGEELDYNYLNDHIKTLYKNESRAGVVILIFSLLSVFIASLGLLGMAIYLANGREKEIIIRKVLGAKTTTLFKLMVKDIIKWVLLANIVAWPVGYYLLNEWLQNYSYRIELGISVFLFSGLISLVIALATVSFNIAKVTFINPADGLRYE